MNLLKYKRASVAWALVAHAFFLAPWKPKTRQCNGYDGEQGGGHAEPIGGRDYFYYGVTGEVYSTSIQPVDIPKKVNDIVNRINDAYNSGSFESFADSENRQPEDSSSDTNRSHDNHDLTGSDNLPDRQPENADNGSWDKAEVKPPVDVATAEAAVGGGGWLSDFLTSLASRGRYQDTVDRSKANAALGDLKSIDNLEATGDLTAAEAKVLREAAGKELGTGAVATRINIRNGDNKSGLNHAWKNHGPDAHSNKSRFNDDITKDDVISILREKNTVNTPAY